jgi:hypothetical protein
MLAYDELDPVCWQCFEDDRLRKHIKSVGAAAKCCLCAHRRKCLTIAELATLIAPIIREHFRWGREERVFDGEDDDTGRFEQRGESLPDVLQTILSQWLPIQDTLTATLVDQDPADIRDGGEPFMSDETFYEESQVNVAEHFARWRAVQGELQHKRRYFSETAKEFFIWLFDGIEELVGPSEPRGEMANVASVLEAGAKLFRSRLCTSAATLQSVMSDPGSALGAPPPEFAQAGRMNALGVPVFYASFDRITCIAEVRPPLWGRVAVGEFSLLKPVRLLDFRRLEGARYSSKTLSFFDPMFTQKVEKRKFTARLHELIREHVLPGEESQYLITQAMAEYLAHVRRPAFDGLMFGSAQRQGGVNVVLFPANFGAATAPAISTASVDSKSTELLRFERDSVQLHHVTKIEYQSEERMAAISRDGRVVTYDPYAGWDNEEDPQR